MPQGPTDSGSWVLFLWEKHSTLRAALYVDGFNLYHAIDDLRDNRLKWLSLYQLGQTIIRRRTETLTQVVYFSAYAHYRSARDPSVVARHRQYVAALNSTGVEVVLGNSCSLPAHAESQCKLPGAKL
jgi:hypothetical protein